MGAFDYGNTHSVEEAISLLGSNWSEAAELAGGTDLVTLVKDSSVTPGPGGKIKQNRALSGAPVEKERLRLGAAPPPPGPRHGSVSCHNACHPVPAMAAPPQDCDAVGITGASDQFWLQSLADQHGRGIQRDHGWRRQLQRHRLRQLLRLPRLW